MRDLRDFNTAFDGSFGPNLSGEGNTVSTTAAMAARIGASFSNGVPPSASHASFAISNKESGI